MVHWIRPTAEIEAGLGQLCCVCCLQYSLPSCAGLGQSFWECAVHFAELKVEAGASGKTIYDV